MTNYVILSKSQKALQDILDMSTAIVDGSQVTFNALPASAEKDHLLLNELKSLFTIAKINGNGKISKHQASKKGHKHENHKASKGEFNHAVYIMNGGKK